MCHCQPQLLSLSPCEIGRYRHLYQQRAIHLYSPLLLVDTRRTCVLGRQAGQQRACSRIGPACTCTAWRSSSRRRDECPRLSRDGWGQDCHAHLTAQGDATACGLEHTAPSAHTTAACPSRPAAACSTSKLTVWHQPAHVGLGCKS